MKVRAVAISLLVVGSLFAVVGGASPIAVAPMTQSSVGMGPADGGSNNSTSMGSQVSSFMQSSAGETSESVESGMWDAAFDRANGTEAKATVVEQRLANLETRLASLQAEKQAVMEAYESGSISQRTYQARMSNLVGRITALNRTIDTITSDANQVGANASAVESLRQTARNISGSDMGEIAGGMAGGPPEDLPGQAKNASNPGNGAGPGNNAGNGNNGAGEGKNGGGQGNEQSDGSGEGEGADSGQSDGGNENGADNDDVTDGSDSDEESDEAEGGNGSEGADEGGSSSGAEEGTGSDGSQGANSGSDGRNNGEQGTDNGTPGDGSSGGASSGDRPTGQGGANVPQ